MMTDRQVQATVEGFCDGVHDELTIALRHEFTTDEISSWEIRAILDRTMSVLKSELKSHFGVTDKRGG